MSKQKTIVYFPSIPYEFALYQNPNQILSRFAKKGYKVYYCNPYSKTPKKYLEEVEKNLIVIYDFFKFIEEYKDTVFDIRLVSVPQYVTKYPYPKGKVNVFYLYDHFDHWKKAEKEAFLNSDIVLTTSDILYNLRQKEYNHPCFHVVKNAVPEYYIKHRKKIPKKFKNLKKPIILFVGAIASWVDTELMAKIGKKYTCVFIGKELDKKCPKEVINLGVVHNSKLVDYYASADVGIIPFNINGEHKEITKCSNPIKMYEYMGAGIPCVATSWEETCMFPDVVFPSKNHNEFMKNIEYALSLEKTKFKNFAKKEASIHTWEIRVDKIEEIINNYANNNNINLESEIIIDKKPELKNMKEKIYEKPKNKNIDPIEDNKTKIQNTIQDKESQYKKLPKKETSFNYILEKEEKLNNPNTIQYWNNRYKNKDWDKNGGIKQSTFFAKLIFNNIPEEITQDIKNNNLSIADIGCSLGELCNITISIFPKSNISGYDLSDVVINRCKNMYKTKNIKFYNNLIDKKHDVIFASHILEHYYNTEEILSETLKYCNKYCIILCPYEEEKRHKEHVVNIDKKFFKDNISGFNKIYEDIIDTKNSKYWNGENILIIYKK